MENYDLSNFEPAAKIVVIGVGGAGNNAVNRMIDEEIANVTFWVANTDKQALSTSKSGNRMVLGPEITGGLGAGGEPEIGENEIKVLKEEGNMKPIEEFIASDSDKINLKLTPNCVYLVEII
jgi:cell division GTPase FtsZ